LCADTNFTEVLSVVLREDRQTDTSGQARYT